MRFATAWLVAGFSIAAGSSPVLGHDLWLEPADLSPAVGQAVAVHLHLGHGGGEAEAIGRPGDRLLRFSVTDPQGREDPVPGLDGRDPAGLLRPREAGLHVIGYHTSPLSHSLSAGRFRRVLEEEGLEAVHRLRVAAGTETEGTTERYWRCLKALLAVGDGEGPGADRPLGLPLELVARFDPRKAGAGSPLTLDLLYRGEPLAGARVAAHSLDAGGDPVEVRSAGDGRVELALPHAGGWRIHAVHMVEGPPQSGVEWESFWTALSLELPAANP